MNTSNAPLRVWHTMTGREQSVWGAAYSSHPEPGPAAAQHADAVVATLARVDCPEREAPEHRAARLCIGLTPEEFRAWYLVERKIVSHHRPQPAMTEADLQEAYEVYVMCGCDYY